MDKECKHCHNTFVATRSTAEFCSTKCRVYFNRKKSAPDINNVQEAEVVSIVIDPRPAPPSHLKGIDITIWKDEHWK